MSIAGMNAHSIHRKKQLSVNKGSPDYEKPIEFLLCNAQKTQIINFHRESIIYRVWQLLQIESIVGLWKIKMQTA